MRLFCPAARDQEILEIKNWLNIATKRPGNLLISGDPGLGKTETMRYCLMENVKDPIITIFIPATSIKNAKGVFDLISSRLQKHQKVSSINEQLSIIKEEIERDPLLIILDDIRANITDYILNTLVRLNQEVARNHVSVVIISNERFIGDQIEEKTKSAAQLKKIFFIKYSDFQIEQILTYGLDKKLIKKIPRSVYSEITDYINDYGQGDARSADELFNQYLEAEKPDIKQLILAHQDNGLSKMLDTLECEEHYFLYALSLSPTNPNTGDPLALQELYTFYKLNSIRHHSILGFQQFRNVALYLDKKGFISYHTPGKSAGRGRTSIVLLRRSLLEKNRLLRSLLEIKLGIEIPKQEEYQLTKEEQDLFDCS
jgi:Cdc6-like AAA superfamily ATPase